MRNKIYWKSALFLKIQLREADIEINKSEKHLQNVLLHERVYRLYVLSLFVWKEKT